MNKLNIIMLQSLDELDDDLRELQQQFIGCQIRHAAVCQDDDVSARGNRGNTSYDVTSLLATGSRKSSAPAGKLFIRSWSDNQVY